MLALVRICLRTVKMGKLIDMTKKPDGTPQVCCLQTS